MAQCGFAESLCFGIFGTISQRPSFGERSFSQRWVETTLHAFLYQFKEVSFCQPSTHSSVHGHKHVYNRVRRVDVDPATDNNLTRMVGLDINCADRVNYRKRLHVRYNEKFVKLRQSKWGQEQTNLWRNHSWKSRQRKRCRGVHVVCQFWCLLADLGKINFRCCQWRYGKQLYGNVQSDHQTDIAWNDIGWCKRIISSHGNILGYVKRLQREVLFQNLVFRNSDFLVTNVPCNKKFAPSTSCSTCLSCFVNKLVSLSLLRMTTFLMPEWKLQCAKYSRDCIVLIVAGLCSHKLHFQKVRVRPWKFVCKLLSWPYVSKATASVWENANAPRSEKTSANVSQSKNTNQQVQF